MSILSTKPFAVRSAVIKKGYCSGTIKSFRSKRGAASALIVLLIVLLVFFGVLAMVTAAADLRLSEKRAEWVKVHFQADQEAERILADISLLQTEQPTTEALERAILQLIQDRSDLELLELYSLEDDCYLSLLVFNADRFNQGIEFSVRLKPAGKPSELTLLSWMQWQPGAEASERPGLWEG